jgi:hypothetical protein
METEEISKRKPVQHAQAEAEAEAAQVGAVGGAQPGLRGRVDA